MDGPGGASVAEIVTPGESAVFLTCHLARAKSILARVKRAVRVARRSPAGLLGCRSGEPPSRPTRVLADRNRSQVWPWLLDDLVSGGVKSLVESLAITQDLANRGASPHALLDMFARSSDLDWQLAARILREGRLIPGPFSAYDVRAIRQARTFWNLYGAGRQAYAAAVEQKEMPPMAGDWALFEAAQLEELLPGVSIPIHLRRKAYVTNLMPEPPGLCLDLHSFPTGLPLCRHPF